MNPENPPYHAHRQAVAMCRYWWNRHQALPRWRSNARHDALALARLWGIIAKELREEITD